MRKITGAVRLLGIALFILLILLVLTFVFPFIGRERRAWWIRTLSAWVPALCGMRMSVRGRIPDEEAVRSGLRCGVPGYMVCSNHVSFIDIFLLDALLPSRFVAKKEIASWPVFGRISRAVGTLFIDRTRRRAVLEVAELMASSLRKGENVLFFPEGTTGTGADLLPFHANLFTAAVASGSEILPVVLRYTQYGETTTLASYAKQSLFDVLWRIVSTPGLGVEVTVLDPIPSAGEDRHALCASASAAMAAALGVSDATAERERERAAKRSGSH